MHATPFEISNRVFNFLNLKKRLIKAGVTLDDSHFKPFITIAREPGSGGEPIARAVAELLEYEFVNEQIIEDIAKSTKRRKQIVANMDEKSRSGLDALVHSMLSTEHVDKETYIFELVKVILAYASKGKTVILGRGANFITPFAKGLHVNITAPYQVRVQRAIDFEGHSEARAKEVIASVEKERREFVKEYFNADITKVNSYDLTLNTTYFRVEEARDVVIKAFYKKFSRSRLL